MENNRIVIFDGVCNLCNSSVDILVRLDHGRSLKFASLQGRTARELNIFQERLDIGEQSILYLKDNMVYYRSNAILEIISDITWWGKALKVFKVVPQFIRDGVYKFIAKNRYKIFGQRETCRYPTEEEKAYFLP